MLTPITFAEGYPEIPENPYGILKGIVEANAFRKGSWGAQIIDELEPQADDIVIEGKRGLDCFFTTNLDFILRARGVKNVVLAGFLTNACVESTMRSRIAAGSTIPFGKSAWAALIIPASPSSKTILCGIKCAEDWICRVMAD